MVWVQAHWFSWKSHKEHIHIWKWWGSDSRAMNDHSIPFIQLSYHMCFTSRTHVCLHSVSVSLVLCFCPLFLFLSRWILFKLCIDTVWVHPWHHSALCWVNWWGSCSSLASPFAWFSCFAPHLIWWWHLTFTPWLTYLSFVFLFYYLSIYINVSIYIPDPNIQHICQTEQANSVTTRSSQWLFISKLQHVEACYFKPGVETRWRHWKAEQLRKK